jgi:arabinan endo-1,5-alpha-L-arabinosidase
MVLHLRELFFTPDGWPVVSPQRYAGDERRIVSEKEIAGDWEIIRIRESTHERQLEAGQIMWGKDSLENEEWNSSYPLRLHSDGTTSDHGSWSFNQKNQTMTFTVDKETIRNLYIFAGHDWEKQTRTILLTGLDDEGRSVWGKRIK